MNSPGARAIGRLANNPIRKHPIILPIAVAVMYCRFISSKHISYSGSKISPLGGTQGPPDSLRILGFTARMYAIVRKVAVPALNSVLSLDPRSPHAKNFPTLELLKLPSNLLTDSLIFLSMTVLSNLSLIPDEPWSVVILL